jgi:hypothetical protein
MSSLNPLLAFLTHTKIIFTKFEENCLPPELIIKEGTLKGREIQTRTICNFNYKIPQVFHYKSNFVKIIFVWVRNARSGFKIDIDFQKSSEYNYIYHVEFVAVK